MTHSWRHVRPRGKVYDQYPALFTECPVKHIAILYVEVELATGEKVGVAHTCHLEQAHDAMRRVSLSVGLDLTPYPSGNSQPT